jgi:hypothetical protein
MTGNIAPRTPVESLAAASAPLPCTHVAITTHASPPSLSPSLPPPHTPCVVLTPGGSAESGGDAPANGSEAERASVGDGPANGSEAERARLQRVAGDAVPLADEWLFTPLFARGLLPAASQAVKASFLRLMDVAALVVG